MPNDHCVYMNCALCHIGIYTLSTVQLTSQTEPSSWVILNRAHKSNWKPKQGGCLTMNSVWGQGLHLIQYNFHCRSIAHYFNCSGTEVIDTLNVFNMALAWNFIFQNHHDTVCMALMVKSLFFYCRLLFWPVRCMYKSLPMLYDFLM